MSKFKDLETTPEGRLSSRRVKVAATQLVKQTMADLGIDSMQTKEQVGRGVLDAAVRAGFPREGTIELMKSYGVDRVRQHIQRLYDLAPDPTKPGGMNRPPSKIVDPIREKKKRLS